MVPPSPHCHNGRDNATEVFVYTGIGEGDVVPHDIVRVRIDQTVLAIPIEAFMLSFTKVYAKLVHRHSSLAQR